MQAVAQSISRRAIFAGAALLPAAATLAAVTKAHADSPDAELLALGGQLKSLLPQVRANTRANIRLGALRDERCMGLTYSDTDLQKRIAVEDEIGFSACVDEGDALSDRLQTVMDRCNAISAETVAGLKVKAQLALFFAPAEEDNWGGPSIKALIEDVLAWSA